MRITYVIDSLGSGGAQRQLVELASWLHGRDGARAHVLHYRPDDFFAARLDEAGVPRTLVPRNGALDVSFPARFRRALRATRPDLVHAFLLVPGLWSWLASRGTGGPALVAAERNSRIATNAVEASLQRLLYRSADAVTVNAEPVVAEINSRLGVPIERLHYLPNGIDLERWDRARAARCPIEIDRTEFHLAMVGGLRPQKNHLHLFRALARIPVTKRYGLRVWCIGDHTSGDTIAHAVHAAVLELGLEETVRFAAATDNLPALLARMDGLVLASAWEGFPNVVLEALASGLPVVATDVGGAAALVVPDETGWLVPSADEDALADAILALAASPPDRRVRFGQNGRKLVEERFSIRTIGDQHAAFYRRQLNIPD